MKKLLFVLAFGLFAFASCSTAVDTHAPYEQKPIVYGILDANADTTFIKIGRTFYVTGDPFQSAANPDSNNYPGRLDVRLIEYWNGDSVREIVLDTITRHNKPSGTFYAPDQKLYYTTEPLTQNTSGRKVRYRLSAVLPDRVLNTETDMVGSTAFGVQSLGVNFAKEYFGTKRSFLFRPATNAAFYEIQIAFSFKEQYTPDGDSVPRTVCWDMGTYLASDLDYYMTDGYYVFQYRPETFWTALAQFIGDDTIGETRRFFSSRPVEITIRAGGYKLWEYIYFNGVLNGLNTEDNAFTLVDEGYGVFSSRIVAKRKVGLAGRTVPDLLEKLKWGFKYIGGED